MKFIVDANLGRRFTSLLNNAGHDAVFIKDLLSKASDEDVLSIAESEVRVIITNDKDFGWLVFKLGRPVAGIILLRTLATDPEKRFEMIRGILDRTKGKFIVVSEGRIRVKEL